MTSLTAAPLGFGLGLRSDHYAAILERRPRLDWFEILSENYMVGGGPPLANLLCIRADYPMVMHGVSLSIGASDPLDENYLNELKKLSDIIEPKWISDHLCWTGYGGVNLHDLMPLPATEEAVRHVAERVRRVQDRLGRRLLLENVSSYVAYAQAEMPEWQFLGAVAEQADCLILLDINNIYVSAFNHDFNALDYLDGVPAARIQQFHLAGHRNYQSHIIDTHDQLIIDPVFELYGEAVRRFGPISTMIERDDNIPPLQELLDELDRVRGVAASAVRNRAA
ncbi:MAG: DUF692 domain-containing protein [Alphaproteobacteria bacterium]|nr:DUF692 domain-containing protein [Alphaproteobacteria bacterium]